MEYEFDVLDVEENFESVASPQVLIINTGLYERKVFVYFMANTALNITDGIAQSAMGKIKLQYTAESPSGAMTASQTLRKICFTFKNSQGMANSYEFLGERL